MHMLRAVAQAATTAPPGFWEWASASFSLGDVISTSGLLTIVALLYTGRLVPIGQHRRELDQQKVYYEGRLAELQDSRDYYRDARLEEKTRGDKLTDAMMEQVELTKTAVKVLASVDEAAAAKGA